MSGYLRNNVMPALRQASNAWERIAVPGPVVCTAPPASGDALRQSEATGRAPELAELEARERITRMAYESAGAHYSQCFEDWERARRALAHHAPGKVA